MILYKLLLTVATVILVPVAYFVFNTIKWMIKKRQIGRKVDLIPGPKREWLFGNIRQVILKILNNIK